MPTLFEPSAGRRQFLLQWHLTARCEERCRHCYMHDSPSYESELENELSPGQCLAILDDFTRTVRGWGVEARINFSGGDPLLRRDLLPLVRKARSRGFSVGILGNPHLLTRQTALALKEAGASRYQLSLDGLERTHDSLRGRRGAFRDALRAIRVLDEAGLPSVVMFTLSRLNAPELIPVIRLCARKNVRIFDFARLVPTGTGKALRDQLLGAAEYRELLLRVLEEYRRQEAAGSRTYFGRKENLWVLLYKELGLLPPLPRTRGAIVSGCSVGSRIMTVLADGTVLACRRLPVELGRVPGGSLREIFISSKNHRRLRSVEKLERCAGCGLLPFCRGCPAVAHGATGDFLAGDPQCWRVVGC
ncbi:MAG: radical SAM protein [Euryarchaeota archaeon]|nr:radical SAM protein [Euryarchaeota archaeon]